MPVARIYQHLMHDKSEKSGFPDENGVNVESICSKNE